MSTHIKAFVLVGILLVTTPVYANEQGWSWAPAKAVIMTFWATVAVVGNPSIGTMMYRYVALSPMAIVTAGMTSVFWNTITNPSFRSLIKNRASDVIYVPH